MPAQFVLTTLRFQWSRIARANRLSLHRFKLGFKDLESSVLIVVQGMLVILSAGVQPDALSSGQLPRPLYCCREKGSTQTLADIIGEKAKVHDFDAA